MSAVETQIATSASPIAASSTQKLTFGSTSAEGKTTSHTRSSEYTYISSSWSVDIIANIFVLSESISTPPLSKVGASKEPSASLSSPGLGVATSLMKGLVKGYAGTEVVPKKENLVATLESIRLVADVSCASSHQLHWFHDTDFKLLLITAVLLLR